MPDDPKAILEREARRSDPDYIVYVPGHWDGSTNDSENEHFLVFDGPDGSLMAVWTQATEDSATHRFSNRIVFARSDDEGETWTDPLFLGGMPDNSTPMDEPPYMAGWAFPMVSKSGRIYVLWNQNNGLGGRVFFHTGWMAGTYSDDNGATWAEPQDIPMRFGAFDHSPYDDPERRIPPEWIVWQIPMRDLSGGFIVGYSHWSRYLRPLEERDYQSVVEFMRFVNIDDHPEPRDIRLTYHAWGDEALRVPRRRDPLKTCCEEPSLVRLPDDRLFCIFRTDAASIWYSVSDDDGAHWANPRPLLRRDKGLAIPQPISCCPIYPLGDGRYVLLHHNNPGDFDKPMGPRRPCYLALGEFRPEAEQPIWFSESKAFLDNGGHKPSGEEDAGANIGIYGSFTSRNGNHVYWDSDRKAFLIGKRVTEDFLADLSVPR